MTNSEKLTEGKTFQARFIDHRNYQRQIELSPILWKEQNEKIIDVIQQAGPIMVIDPEKAVSDLQNTIERTRIASEMGMKVILIGGSTDSGESNTVVPIIRNVLESVGGNTLLIAFPGSSRQIVRGVHAALLLELPQIHEVFKQNKALEILFRGEHDRIIQKCEEDAIPLIPVKYLLFSAGNSTSVEKVTGISGISVSKGVNVPEIMKLISLWCKVRDLVFLELGSGPDKSVNLAPIAQEIFNITEVIPIISGGVTKPEHIRQITAELPHSVGFGSLAENTKPEFFRAKYQSLLSAHPLYANKQ